MALSTAHATRALASVHFASGWNTLRSYLAEKRLLLATVIVFLAGYAVIAHALIAAGLTHVHALPILGPMLTERLLFVLFFFFFAMLIVSNATITGMGLFRKKETGWLISMPVTFRSVVLWQMIEGTLLASWGLLLLSAPILLAVGKVLDSPRGFYLHTVPTLLCLVLIASNVSTWFLLAMMRWLRREWLQPMAWSFVVALAVAAWLCWPDATAKKAGMDVNATLGHILRYSDKLTHPLAPSSWVAESLLAAGRGELQVAWLYTLTLLSTALLSIAITVGWVSGWFYPSWVKAMQPAPQKRRSVRSTTLNAVPAWLRFLPGSEGSRALVLKDVRTFLREPAQWGQCAVVFGLLFLYTGNLRRIVYDVNDPFWSVLTSYLNLFVCGLSLSTLTTRFIFPQMSLEGQRLWLFGLSPLPMHEMLTAKLRLTATVTGLLTSALTLTSCLLLNLSWQRTAFFVSCMIMLTLGLNMLALGTGTLLPSFREPNPAKVVSGFGGTICLILSFVYLMLCMGVAAFPALPVLRPGWGVTGVLGRVPSEFISLAVMLVLTGLFGWLPYRLGRKKIMSLDFFRAV